MPTIDEILDAMPDEVAETGREYLTIDPLSRTITVPESERVFAVTGDEYADRKYFRCPRIVGDGLDLAAMFVRVNFRNAGGDEDGYLVDDVAVSGDYVTFSWRLWPKVAEYMGAVQFSVCADLPDTEGRKMPDWNTTLASGEVLEGMHPYDGAVEEETSDVVTQLRSMTAAQTGAVEAVGAQQVQEVQEAANAAQEAAVAAVQAQGAATVASIPADYTTLAATVDRLTRDRAAAIVCEAQGTAIQVTDASADPLQGLRIFGRSTQDGTPEAPVEIVSLAAPVVTVAGKNLINCAGASAEMTDAYHMVFITGFKPTQGQTYTLSMNMETDVLPYAIHVGAGKGAYHSDFNPNIVEYFAENGRISITFVWELSAAQIAADFTELAFRVPRYAVLTNFKATVSNIQLEVGDVATAYEPHKPLQTITTTHTLPGIPVTSGGNYTDENGQQWIADEVDLARGVYVQNVRALTFDGTEAWGIGGEPYPLAFLSDLPLASARVAGMFSHGEYRSFSSTNGGHYAVVFENGILRMRTGHETNIDDLKAYLSAQHSAGSPVTIHYALATPTKTPLTDAEIQAFRALHSVKPTTTVLTDTGAHMALEYAADPKTYIDNKLTALVAAAAN